MSTCTPLILTLDLGTSYFKGALFDLTGRMIRSARCACPLQSPHPGWSQMPVPDFQTTIIELVQQLHGRDEALSQRIAAMSFATQANSFALLDHQDEPLTPFLIWNDQRAEEPSPIATRLNDLDNAYATTGVSRRDNQFMPAKLDWLTRHQPEVRAAAGRLCLISDYLTLWLTGEHVAEASSAALTGLVDIHKLDWWDAALAVADLDRNLLGRMTGTGEEVGRLRSEAASQLGLPVSCRFIAGCLDQYAGAIGAGNVEPGHLCETTGTVLSTVRCAAHFDPEQTRWFQGPAFKRGLYYQMIFGNTSANLLEIYRNRLPDAPSFETLTALAATVPADCDGLVLNTSSPHEPLIFEHRKPNHGRGHEVRAILEAVAVALSQQVAQLCGQALPRSIVSVGGAARSDLWLQIKANRLGRPMIATTCQEPTSLGAALLAGQHLMHQPLPELAKSWIGYRITKKPEG